MKINISLMLLLMLCLVGCGANEQSNTAASGFGKASYTRIAQDEAQRMMQETDEYIILDVRTREEYDSGHIPGAVLIPNEEIGKERPEELPELDTVILVYCRSGNRSRQAAQKLADMGYSNVYEFGGINSWTGELE